jgi:uncharacterized protein YdgA (DUF945 family)
LDFKHSIRHGPLLSPATVASIHSELIPSEELVAMLVDTFGSDPFAGKAPLTAETTIGWGGRSHTRIASPGTEVSGGEGQIRFSWGGLDGEISMDSARSKTKANIVVGGFSIVGSNEDQFQTGRITFRADVEQPAGYEFFPVGTASFVQERFWFRVRDKNTGTMRETELENAQIEFSAAINNDVGEGKIRFDVDKVVMENGTIIIEKPGATFLFENIDVQAHEAIQKAMQEQDRESMHYAFFREQIKALLQRKPALTIKDLSVYWPEGMMAGNLRVAYEGDGNITGLSLSDLVVDLQFSLPRTLVVRLLGAQAATEDVERKAKRQTDILNTMIENGVLIEKDGILSIDANLKDGALALNGQSPKPFEAFLGLLGSLGF